MGTRRRISPVAFRDGDRDKLTPKERANMKNFISLVLSFELTHCQFLVLLFIYNRTYRFNKLWERIPLRHFLEGVYSNEERGGLYFVRPLPFKEAAIRLALRQLVGMEIVDRRRKFNKNGIHVNEYRIHTTVRNKVGERRVVEWGDILIDIGYSI